MTLCTDRGAALAQLGEIFYGGVFLSKYNSLEKFHLVTANFLGHSLSLIFKIPQTYRIYLNIGPNWPNWQCCLAGSSKRAPRILIFSIAMDADYTFYVKIIETHARAFLPLNISAIGTVRRYSITAVSDQGS